MAGSGGRASRRDDGASLIVGIAGGSGAGKTTIAKALVERLDGRAVRIAHDAYYHDQRQRPLELRRRVNYDHPDSLETTLLCEHLDELRSRRAVDLPRYDFAQHTRQAETQRMRPAPIVVVDGILALVPVELRLRLDVMVFVEAREHVRLERRIARDAKTRGRSADSVRRQWHSSVQPMFEAFVEPSRAHADLIVPGEGEIERRVQLLADAISRRASRVGQGSARRSRPDTRHAEDGA